MVDQWTLFDDPPAPRRGEYPLPDHGAVEACKSCGQSCIWARTANDRPILLSLATVVERHGQKYALAHFADCPDAKDWSTRRS